MADGEDEPPRADVAWQPIAGYAAQERLAHKVEDALEEMKQPVVDLITYSRKNRVIIWWLTVTTVLDLAVSGVSVYALVRATEATAKVATACESRNAFKALDLSRWQFILDQTKLAPPAADPVERAAAKARLDAFEVFIVRADSPEKC